MDSGPNDAEFHARVHQGHVDNFHRKILAAEHPTVLDMIMQSINAAVSRQIIDSQSDETLRSAVERQRQALKSPGT